ncbi:MAG: DinB family protein [Eudoraea sp.]|nr:DinB family protein [Eudoraea sp.]
MKNFILLILCLTTISISAQNKTLESLVADFERSKAMSLEYIEAMPEDKFDFKPTESVRSFAAQMLHGAQGTIGLAANGTGEAPIYGDINIEQQEAFHTKSEVMRIVGESFDFAINGIQNMDPTKLDEVVVRGPYNVTRLGWIQKANEHVGHHRGQCAIYLRLQGITPPAYKLF